MKLIITGGRNYEFTEEDRQALDELHTQQAVTEVVSGGCSGGAKCGELWAREHGIPVRVFPAEWKTHGKAAGPLRNRQMAEHADAVALFPGGRGTISMHAEAVRANLTVYDYRDAMSGGRRVVPSPPQLPPSFGARVHKGLAWWIPLWMIATFIPLLAGNLETFGARLILGTPMICVFVVVYAAIRTSIASIERSKA